MPKQFATTAVMNSVSTWSSNVPASFERVHPWEIGSCDAVIVSTKSKEALATLLAIVFQPGLKTIASCCLLADVPLISQMKAAGISYGVEIAYRSISKYSC